MFSDKLTEAILEERVTEDLVHAAVRRGVLDMNLTPVFLGSAYKNKGVQKLLDAVNRYLPAPTDVVNTGVDLSRAEAAIDIRTDPNKPLVALAFKLEDGRYGQLTYVRVYRHGREQPHQEEAQGGAPRAHARRQHGRDRLGQRG
jgi:elongation factor G